MTNTEKQNINNASIKSILIDILTIGAGAVILSKHIMKFRKEYFLLITISLLCCSFIKFQNNLKTGFSEICVRIGKEYRTHDHHGLVHNNNTNKYLNLAEFSVILNKVSKYDLDKTHTYKIKKSKTGKIERTIWESLSKKDKLVSLEKVVFETEIESEYEGEKYKNKFTIVDYLIIRKDTPKKIYLRLANNDELEEVSIGNTKYSTIFESRILGLNEAEMEFDKILQKQ